MTLWLLDFSIFIDAQIIDFSARIDNLRHENHVSSPYRSDFSHFRPKWHICMWLCDCLILEFYYRCTIELSGSSIDTLRHHNPVSSPYVSDFCSKLELQICDCVTLEISLVSKVCISLVRNSEGSNTFNELKDSMN